MDLPANSTQAEAIARDIIICNVSILREHCMIISEDKIYVSVNVYKDTCEYCISTKE